jgi:hypothetical protein
MATKAQTKRIDSLIPSGTPRYIRCYDNKGETADRYTCVFTGNYTHKTGREYLYLGMSSDPFHPLGIGINESSKKQIDTPSYSHLGKKVKFEDLPEKVQQCIKQTYVDIWDLPTDLLK